MKVCNVHVVDARSFNLFFRSVLCCDLKWLVYGAYGHVANDVEHGSHKWKYLTEMRKKAGKDFMSWYCDLDLECAARLVAILDYKRMEESI